MKWATKKVQGFTLIELLVGIAIVSMMMVAIIPFMQQMQAGYERRAFIARVNSVAQVAWQQAVITGSVHRVFFNMNERQVFVEREEVSSDPGKKVAFEPIKVDGASAEWSKSVEVKQFIIGGFDEMKRSAGGRTKTVWFYVIPDGMTQEVIINGIDKSDLIENKPQQFGLVMNPFLGQFAVYDTFQK